MYFERDIIIVTRFAVRDLNLLCAILQNLTMYVVVRAHTGTC